MSEEAITIPRADGVIYRPKTASKIRLGPEGVQVRPLPAPDTKAEPIKPVVLRPGVTAHLLAKIYNR